MDLVLIMSPFYSLKIFICILFGLFGLFLNNHLKKLRRGSVYTFTKSSVVSPVDFQTLYKKCENEYWKFTNCGQIIYELDKSIEILCNICAITHFMSKDAHWICIQNEERRMNKTQTLILKYPNQKIFIVCFKFIRNYFITKFIQKHVQKVKQIKLIEKLEDTFWSPPNGIIYKELNEKYVD